MTEPVMAGPEEPVFLACLVDTDPNCFYYFDTDHEQPPVDYIYRAGYWYKDNDTMHAFAPDPVAVSISQSSGVNGTFRAQLPEDGLEDGYYFVIAWLDADGDGELDLVDSYSDSHQIASSEFNRCPKYDTGGYYASNFYYSAVSGYSSMVLTESAAAPKS